MNLSIPSSTPQVFGNNKVWTFKGKDSDGSTLRYVKIQIGADPRLLVLPSDMLRLAAGRDQWMRQIVLKCSYCDARHPASEMADGICCPKCLEEAEKENAAANGE